MKQLVSYFMFPPLVSMQTSAISKAGFVPRKYADVDLFAGERAINRAFKRAGQRALALDICSKRFQIRRLRFSASEFPGTLSPHYQ